MSVSQAKNQEKMFPVYELSQNENVSLYHSPQNSELQLIFLWWMSKLNQLYYPKVIDFLYFATSDLQYNFEQLLHILLHNFYFEEIKCTGNAIPHPHIFFYKCKREKKFDIVCF